MDPADGTSRVLGVPTHLGLVGINFHRWDFSALEGFSFSMQISYHAQSILSDLSGNRSEEFGGLDVPTLIPILSLIPVLFSRSQDKDVCPRKVLPCLCRAPSPATSCFFSQCIITKNPWLFLPTVWLVPQLSGYLCLRYTHWPLIFQASATAEYASIQIKSETRCLYPVTSVHPIVASLT